MVKIRIMCSPAVEWCEKRKWSWEKKTFRPTAQCGKI